MEILIFGHKIFEIISSNVLIVEVEWKKKKAIWLIKKREGK